MPTRRPAAVLGLLSILLALLTVVAPVGSAEALAKPKGPKVSIGDATVTETDGPGVVATFPVTLKKGTGKKVTVRWTATGLTASAGATTAPRWC